MTWHYQPSQRAAVILGTVTLTSITVTPSTATIEVGETQQFTATGHYSDGSTADLTATAIWSSDDEGVFTIDSSGLATGVGSGTDTAVTATSGVVSGQALLTVIALSSIAVTPSSASITLGNTQQFTATGHYTDSSTADLTASVTWSSSDTGIATIDSAGLASPVGDGTATITAESGAVSGTASLTVVVTISGTTRDALATGSAAIKFVVAIEGYERLLSDADADAVLAAWSGTDYTDVISGLMVQLERTQQISPWKPFQEDGGTAILRVLEDSFGVDTHRRTAGAETYLTATADRNATTLSVKDASAFASSGTVYIGTESIAYTGKTSTSFTGCTRGQFSALQNGQGGAWAEHHRVGADALGVLLEPVVSEQPRVWIGKWVGVWLHKTNGTQLNAKADAQLIFAGRIASIADDPETGATVVEVKSVQATVADSSLGRDMWSAKVTDGVYISAGQTLTMSDNDYSGGWKTSNSLTVVASGASGANQINAGIYTLDELASAINSWLASEKAANRIYGLYSLHPAEKIAPGVFRGQMNWYIPSTQPEAEWKMSWPWGDIFGGTANPWVSHVMPANDWHAENSAGPPVHNALFRLTNNSFALQCTVESQSGIFVDQYALLPARVKQLVGTQAGLSWGVFLYNETMLFVGALSGDTITSVYPIDVALTGSLQGIDTLQTTTLSPADSLPSIRQIFLIEDTVATILKNIFYGSGATNHNSATYDSLGYGLGIGIPGELLDSEFEDSIDALPGADATIAVVIDKTSKLTDLLEGDEILRLAFLRWKLGHLEFKTWITPTADASVATLDESNKAEPSGNVVNHRSASIETPELVKDTFKIQYNRQFSADKEGDYGNVLTLEDRVSVDDNGGEGRLVTIKARNTFPQFTGTGTGVEALFPNLLASMPLFSRPKPRMTRSIGLPLFEEITVGDVVTVTDNFARDPATGQRGIASRPAVITKHSCNYGGFAGPDNVTDMAGEVDVYYLDNNRVTTYVPCAQVDETATNAGYDSTNHTLTVYAHAHSNVLQGVDASNFADGYDVLIVEIDPADPASPLSWSRTLTGVSGNVLSLNSALSSPSWDSSKRYRVIFDHFAADETAQQAKAFQALASTASIESSGAPYQYGIGQGAVFAHNSTSNKAELHATLSYGDGKPRDVGYERGLVRTLNALVDYKTAQSAPSLSNTILENTTYSSGSGYQLQAIVPMFVCADKWASNQTRSLRVSPWYRSSTGASVTVRVTICRAPTSSTSKNDVTMPTPNVSATWTTTSTTWQAGTAADLDLGLKVPITGLVWIHIETTIHGQTRLLAECRETARS